MANYKIDVSEPAENDLKEIIEIGRILYGRRDWLSLL